VAALQDQLAQSRAAEAITAARKRAAEQLSQSDKGTLGSAARASEPLKIGRPPESLYPADAPTPSPSAPPAAAATEKPENQKEQQRANRGVDNRADNSKAKMDAELRQQPTANEGSYDSDDEVVDESVSSATDNLTSQPSRDEANQKEDEETFTRHDILRILDGTGCGRFF
jgi:hypothetical protein